MRISRFAWATAVGVMWLPAIASADVISYSDGYGPGGLQEVTDWSQTLTLPGFNTTLGRLTSVTVTLADVGAIFGKVKNTAATAENFSVTENIALTATGPPILAGLANKLTESQVYTDLASQASANFGFFSPSDAASITDSSPADFAFFESADFSSLVATLTDTTITGGGGNILTQITTTAGATMTVAYNYIPPAAVPEPASLALLASGLVALGLVRRRGRQI